MELPATAFGGPASLCHVSYVSGARGDAGQMDTGPPGQESLLSCSPLSLLFAKSLCNTLAAALQSGGREV